MYRKIVFFIILVFVFNYGFSKQNESNKKPSANKQKYYLGINPDNIDLEEYFKNKYLIFSKSNAAHLKKEGMPKGKVIASSSVEFPYAPC